MAMCLPASLNFKEDYMKSLIFLSLIIYFFYAELSLKAHDQYDGLRRRPVELLPGELTKP